MTASVGRVPVGYAEFLAAQYLRAREVTPSNVLKMLLHPSGGLVPQLAVVTAWAASIGKDVRRELMRTEPMLLLQGDLSDWDERDLSELTGALMSALNENRAHDFSFGITSFYGKLNHPGLASQLRPYILDPSKNAISRRTAILIAEQCKLTELQPELLALAIDRSSDPYLRGRAIDALSDDAETNTVPPRLLPFSQGRNGTRSARRSERLRAANPMAPAHIRPRSGLRTDHPAKLGIRRGLCDVPNSDTSRNPRCIRSADRAKLGEVVRRADRARWGFSRKCRYSEESLPRITTPASPMK